MNHLLPSDGFKKAFCRNAFLGVVTALLVIAVILNGKAGAQSVATEEQQKSEEAVVAAAEESSVVAEGSSVAEGSDFALPQGVVWQSQDEDPPYGDPRAQRGGILRTWRSSFPLSFRNVGPHASDIVPQMQLLTAHPVTSNPLPSLAHHWAIDAARSTVYFRLRPEARWSDGHAVDADDFVFSFKQETSLAIRDKKVPLLRRYTIRSVQAHGPHILSVSLQRRYPPSLMWRYANLSPTPKHFHKLNLSWTKDYDERIEPTTAPYLVTDYKRGEYITYTRNKNWWGDGFKYHQHLYNFDGIHERVVRSLQERWDLFVQGQLDVLFVPQKLWHEWTNTQPFQRGYIQKITSYTDGPSSAAVVYLNLARSPFKDKRVRYALAHALNVQRVIDTVMRGDVERAHSVFPGYDEFTNHDLRARSYNPDAAKALMREAGWSLNDQGLWWRGGKPLSLTLSFHDKRDRPHMKIFREYARKAGFDLKLKELTHYAYYDALKNKKYEMMWSTLISSGSVFPLAYHDAFHSSFAGKLQTNNYTNTADPELDALILRYDRAFDEKKKAHISQEVQQRLHMIGAVIPIYHRPYSRKLKWHHIRFPKTPGTPYGGLHMSRAWWDQKAYEELQKHRKKGSRLPQADVIDTTYRRIYLPQPTPH